MRRVPRLGNAWLNAFALDPALAGVVFFLVWEIANRGVFTYNASVYPLDDADEWRYTACSRLVVHGYRLFDQVFSAQPPLLFISLATSMRVFGESINGARVAVIAAGLLCLLAATALVWVLAGRWAAAVTCILLAVSPGFLIYSHAVEGEMPMAAFGLLSLLFVALALSTGSWGWAQLGGLALAAALLFKFFAVELALPGLWLLWQMENRSRRWLNIAVFAISALVPLALDLLLVSPRRQWDQVVSMHNKAAQVYLPHLTGPLDLTRKFLLVDPGLAILAVVGLLLCALLRRWVLFVFLALWFPGQLLMLLLFRPLFAHHLAILLPSMAVCAGVAVAAGAELAARRRYVFASLTALGAVLYLVFLPRLARADRHVLLSWNQPRVVTLAAYIRRHTSPADFIATDDLAVADTARRLVPPGLCDPSNVRLRSGYLSSAELIAQTRRYHPKLVLPSLGIYQQVPGYMSWLRLHYRPFKAPEGVTAFKGGPKQ